MTLTYSSNTFLATSGKLDQACEWLEALGIRCSPSRIGSYQRLFSSLARHQLTNNVNDFYEEYSVVEFVNAAHEVAEIVRIYEGLSTVVDANMASRLREVAKGRELYARDDADRSGRDFALELSIAAKFARAGVPVDFSDAADVRVTRGNFVLFLECKRLKSAGKVTKRIKEGLNQLQSRYQSAENSAMSRGILVLSIGKLVNAELGVIEAESVKSLSDKAFGHNLAFIQEWKRLWQPPRDPRTLGVAVILDTPALVGPKNLLVTCHEISLSNATLPNTFDYGFWLQIGHDVLTRPG